MGTTLAAFNEGSLSYVLVAAVEGHSELFTNGDTAAVATAWSDTGWTTVKGGLFAELAIKQQIDISRQFVNTGTCVLHMAPQGNGADDVFGVTVGRKTSPHETYLAATLDNTATTVTVKSTSGWPSSGYLHIGTECIAYSGTTATTFTGCTRGAFGPFGSFTDQINPPAGTKSFGHYHRVSDDALSINLQPVVSSGPRNWTGRWVGLWAHRVAGGVLDVKEQAELLFAGTIVDIRDDPNTGAVVIQLKSAVEHLEEAVIGSSQWSGEAEDGCTLVAGDEFHFSDFTVAGLLEADPLVVVASGATGTNEIDAGVYSPTDLCSALSAWIAAETTAARVHGTYSFASPVSIPPSGELRTKVYWTLSSGAVNVGWTFSMPPLIATYLGFDGITETDGGFPVNVTVHYKGSGATIRQHWSDGGTPMRVALTVNASGSSRALFTTKAGTIVDQAALMPSAFLSPLANILGGSTPVGDWGVFLLEEKRLVVAQITDNGDGTVELSDIRPAYYFTSKSDPAFNPVSVVIGASESLKVKQVFAFENSPSILFLLFAISTGTPGYNSPYVNTLPLGCGAGIPFEVADGFEISLARVTASTGLVATIIEKPTKLVDVIGGDLAIRWASIAWYQGSITALQLRTPTIELAQLTSGVTLTDDNKGEPSGNKVNQKSATADEGNSVRPVIKVRYSRDILDPSGDTYAKTTSFVDATSVDDMGGARGTVTINLRNTYRQIIGTGQSIEALLPNFLATMPLFSRPSRKVTRSIDSRYFLRLALGDIVLLTDTFARDPETGLRGLSTRPALVSRLAWNLGGQDISGSTTPMGGEVELVFSDQNPARFAAYVPAGMINDLYSLGSFSHGYDSSGPTIQILANRFTETDSLDSDFFNPGDKIIIIERDPADPDAPMMWERTIASDPGSVSGTAITLTSALSSPAWDGSKQYYVISQAYDDATATQRLNSYQADEADALVLDSAAAYLYGASGADQGATTNAQMVSRYPFYSTDAIEMLPTLVRVDGAGRDVAHEAALARLVNNLIDYKLQPQLPILSNEVMSNTTVTGTGYQLVAVCPVWLNFEKLSNLIQRYAAVAPWAYSTDGTSTKLRVTLSRERPSFSTTDNVSWTGTYSQYEWTGITSTSPTTLSDGSLAVIAKQDLGEAWLSIELGYKCATRGLAKFIVGPREQILLQAV